MSRVILTDARVKALRPRKTAFDIRDGKLAGFGVRVLPSGRKRFFVHSQHRGERVWKIVGDATTMSVGEARSLRRANPRRDPARRGSAPRSRRDPLRGRRRDRVRALPGVWKPGTLNVNRCYLKNQILPRFRDAQVADIDRRDVRDWFASLRATPVAADRSMPVLSVIMREAEAMGLRPEGSNPCLGIRRYRRKGRARFLSDDEIRCLSATLAAHADTSPEQVAVVRLLLLTGCRKSEILMLRWSDYREGHLFLRDSKTGPRTVWLSQPARNVLDGLDRSGQWVFPAPRGRGPRNKGWLEVSGTRSAPKPGCAAFAFTISAIPMPALPCGRARPSSPSPGCSVTGIRKPRSNTPTLPTRWSWTPPRPSAPSWKPDPWPGRERMRLADAAIARLRPREREYTVWDSLVVGLGVRVRPSGGRSYVLLEDAGGRSRRVSLGPVSLKTIAEVRRECHARKASPEPEATGAPGRVAPLFRDFVEGAWKEAHFGGYKPSTKKGVRSVLDRQLLPAFGSKPLDRITLAQVTQWFDRFSRTAPGNANHALDLLRQIMNFAIDRDLLETNPARAVKRNRRTALTRFLSREEIARLHRVLDRQTRNSSREQADIIRLLLLTGCRRSEIVRLRWSEVDRDKLVLADSKTGPRTFPSIPRPGAFSNAGHAAQAPSSFHPRETPPGPAAATLRSGIAPGARRASRTFAFTISGIPMPATR